MRTIAQTKKFLCKSIFFRLICNKNLLGCLLFIIIFFPDVSMAAGSCKCTIEVKNDECLIQGSADIKTSITIKSLKQFTTFKKINPKNTTCGLTGTLLWDLAMKDLDTQKIEIPEGVVTKDWEIVASNFDGTCNFQVDNGSFYSGKEKTEFFGPGSEYKIACTGDSGKQAAEAEALEAEKAAKDAADAAVARGFMYESLDAQQRAAQKGKLEGLAKSTFHLIGDRTPQQVFGGAIKALMGILGSIALAMFVYGGFMIMGAGGTAERIEKGTQIVIWSALGVVVIFASYTLVQFVLGVI